MINVYIPDKSDNISRVDIFEKFSQCISTEISLMCCINILDARRSRGRMRFPPDARIRASYLQGLREEPEWIQANDDNTDVDSLTVI